MSITNGPNLGVMVNGAAGDVHYTQFMAALRALDGLVMPNVKGYLTNTPPGSPTDGDCYIIGAAPTGLWAGKAANVTRWSSTAAAWEFFTPKNGWMLGDNTTRALYRYTAAAWEVFVGAKATVTGSRSANAALASLLTGLATAGIIVDSSTV
jgi:Protein of unknown function (DUF2793)